MTAATTALELFRSGFDTAQIASYFRIPEAKALELVTSQRSTMLGLRNPCTSNRPPQLGWPAGRLAYAGRD